MVKLTSTINQTYGKRNTYKGLKFGIEIEMEGRNLPEKDTTCNQTEGVWSYHQDGSLRGESAEYVFTTPLNRDKAHKAVDDLFKLFDSHRSRLEPSYRTSTHVHVNVSDLTWIKVCNLITLWCIVETLAISWCAPRRSGNLFCIPFSASSDSLTALSYGLENYNQHPDLNEQRLKYAALNIYTLRKFGTLEFRALEGLSSPDKLYVWLDFIENLYNRALEYDNPQSIMREFSANWNENFAKSLLGSLWEPLSKNKTLNEIMSSMQEGVWVAQDLAYNLDWSVQEKQEEEPVSVLKKTKTINWDELVEQVIQAPVAEENRLPWVAPRPIEDDMEF